MEYENRDYDDEPQYPRERSRSPRPDRDGDSRLRSASPAAVRDDRTAQQIREDKKKLPTLAPTFSLPAFTPV